MQKYSFNFSQKTKPLPHQIDAIDFISKNITVPLFDEQGLGKTKEVIAALCDNMAQGIIDGALIICKKHLIDNWKDELETHSYLKYIVLRGTAKEKGLRFMGYTQFYIINYEAVISEVERLKMFLKIRKMAVVLDESHKIKNFNSRTAKAVLAIKDLAKKRIIITGSPVANKPLDLWTQFYFLDNGELLGKDLGEFKKRYSIDLKDKNLGEQKHKFDKLREIMLSHSIRRLKKDVLELPDKVFIEKHIKLEPCQKSLYDKLRDELIIEVTNINGEIVIDESSEILKKILRLVQIASNPLLIDKSYNQTPAKFTLLDGLVEEIICRQEKAIIWTSFVENVISLKNRYKKYGTLMLYGGIPIEKRNEIVKQFRNNNEFKILVANPAAAREGLTLTSANNAIYLDRNFNLVDYLQSQDRIHRISQTRKCYIYKIIAENTIDEYVEDMIYKKKELAGYIQGDKDDMQTENCLTRDELLRILGGRT